MNDAAPDVPNAIQKKGINQITDDVPESMHLDCGELLFSVFGDELMKACVQVEPLP